jgi:hypothetical protein
MAEARGRTQWESNCENEKLENRSSPPTAHTSMMAWSSCLPSPRRRLSSRTPKCSSVATFAPFSVTIRQEAVPTGASPTTAEAPSASSEARTVSSRKPRARRQRTKRHEMPVLLLHSQVEREAWENPRAQQPREHLQTGVVPHHLARNLSSRRAVVALDGERVGRRRQLLTRVDVHPVRHTLPQATTARRGRLTARTRSSGRRRAMWPQMWHFTSCHPDRPRKLVELRALEPQSCEDCPR